MFNESVDAVFFSYAADIWSAGCILLELILQVSPHFSALAIQYLDVEGKKGETKDQLATLLLKLGSLFGRNLIEESVNVVGNYKLCLPEVIPSHTNLLLNLMKDKFGKPIGETLIKILTSMLAPNPKERPQSSDIVTFLQELIILIDRKDEGD